MAAPVVLEKDDYYTTTATFSRSGVELRTVGEGEDTKTYLGPEGLALLVAAARAQGWIL